MSDANVYSLSENSERPERLESMTYKAKIPDSQGRQLNVYVTISRLEGEPYEIFLNCGHQDVYEYMSLMTLLISRMFQAKLPIEAIIHDLKNTFSPVTGHMTRGGYCPSLAARIGLILEEDERQVNPDGCQDKESEADKQA